MTRWQEAYADRVAARYGRAHVAGPYSDGTVLVTDPNGREDRVNEDGVVVATAVSHHVDWNYA